MVHRLHAKFTRRYWFPDFNKHTNESTEYQMLGSSVICIIPQVCSENSIHRMNKGNEIS